MHVVLTGERAAGKSTVVRETLARVGWREPAGFWSARADGRPGEPSLWVSTWSGCRACVARWEAGQANRGLAHQVDALAWAAFCKAHLVDISSEKPIILDELGVLEWSVTEVITKVAELFSRPAPLLAVIQARALARWLAWLPAGSVDAVLPVTPASRAALPAVLSSVLLR